MAINSIFDIAGSGMTAQSVRLNTTASNLANADTASSSIDQTYRARKPIFAAVHQDALNAAIPPSINDDASRGVEVRAIVESDASLERRYQPDHPMADADGYVFYPNVNVVEEMADMMSASRSFQTNVEVLNSAKTMMQRLLTIGQ
ncbi:flagellar basal-body rod protein FlgC [Hahella chejuensis KCTC 2396]|uniref:Flagellar basal-body rod protein FlgC n=1 Tax=Hahella chejuensis (strain KCTC 2396) TaxID=349521 RepID=Q2SDT9_HAHCH|nr:flagellar basal body rod protein FlgC [Hahella chejuensis]ABC31185.1 flagellar basal-body rod protein FlgC [Hahella chejuensis KCTC 2396]